MEALKKVKWPYVIMSLFLIALGVCIFVWPQITANTICIGIGVAALVFGILKLLSYFMRDVKGVALNYDFSIGAIAIIAGAVLLIHPNGIVDMLQVFIGLFLLFDSVFKLQTALDSKRIGVSGWWVTLVFSLVCIVIGLMLVFGMLRDALMTLLAVALIADGVQNLCVVVFAAAAGRAIDRASRELADEPEPAPSAPLPEPEPVHTASAPVSAPVPEPVHTAPAPAPAPAPEPVPSPIPAAEPADVPAAPEFAPHDPIIPMEPEEPAPEQAAPSVPAQPDGGQKKSFFSRLFSGELAEQETPEETFGDNKEGNDQT